MFGVASKQFQSVRNQSQHRLQRFHGPSWTSRQIENQRTSPHATHRPAQRREGSFFGALAAHAFCHALQQPFAHRLRGFRSYVAQRDASSAGGYDEPYFSRQQNERIL